MNQLERRIHRERAPAKQGPRRALTLVLFALTLVAPGAGAQSADFFLGIHPPSPGPLDEVILRVRSACPVAYEVPELSGFVITLIVFEPVPPSLAPCSTDLPYQHSASVGTLAAGRYEARLLFRDGDKVLREIDSRMFVVSSGTRYRVNPGSLVEACGGFIGECRFLGFGGSISIEVDLEAQSARVTGSEFELGAIGAPDISFPSAGDLDPTELVGGIENGEILLDHPKDSRQSAAWRLSPVGSDWVLNGTYDEGCCDRFRYSFSNVLLQHEEERTQLSLGEGRFAVEVRWTGFEGAEGAGHGALLTEDSGWFWFFSPNNAELLVKVLDACDGFGSVWVFATGLTDVGVVVTVEDRVAGETRIYRSPVGSVFEPILDTAAFQTCEAIEPAA